VQAEPNARSETVESTTTAGLKFLDSLKQAKDKTYVLCPLHASHMGSSHTRSWAYPGTTSTDKLQRTTYCSPFPHSS
jgi:hypothetical protein